MTAAATLPYCIAARGADLTLAQVAGLHTHVYYTSSDLKLQRAFMYPMDGSSMNY